MNNNELGVLKAFAEKFAEENLNEYCDLIQDDHLLGSRKEVNDPIWRTIALSPVEVILIDSPLVQRLREIRQLGVVHWVYPGAVHSRFEHTLGVLYQTQNLVQAINRIKQTATQNTLIDRNYEQILRIAAIFHDTGHAVFSHVSEFALNEENLIIEARKQFLDIHSGDLKQISEIIAYYIVRSKAFENLAKILFEKFDGFVSLSEKRDANVQLFIEKVSDAIVGNRISEEIPILHEIISGPFDADKLDYFTRDAHNAGTPSVVDISRLVQKMTVREFSAAELPIDIAKSVSSTPKNYFLFGVKWSGIPVLDELHLARVLLFSKVYKHGKVTAIEQMLSLAIKCLLKTIGIEDTLKLLYNHGDAEFLNLTIDGIFQFIDDEKKSSLDKDDLWLKRFRELCSELKYRRVHVKAFQVQRNYPDSNQETSEQLALASIDFIEDLDTLVGRESLKSQIAALMEEILSHIGENKISRQDLESRISISISGHTTGGTQIGRAFVIPENGKPIKFSKYIVNRTAWANGYMSDQPMAYLFTEKKLADVLYIALERLMRTEYNLTLPPSSMSASKRDPSQIALIKQKLSETSFYKSVPHDIRAIPSRLEKADIDPTLMDLSTKFAAYEVPQVESLSLSLGIDKERIFRWLLQFEKNHRIECALQCLKSLKVIRRADMVKAIKTFISENPEFKGATVVGFGDAKDSGSIQAYFAGDLLETLVGRIAKLHEEASKQGRNSHIIFVDDFIGSGGQSKDILAAGLGVPELRADLGEQRALFGSDEIEYLKSAKVGFVFAAGWDAGKKELIKATKSFDIDAKIHISISDPQIPFLEALANEELSSEEIEDFKNFCEDVGRSLISSTQETPNDKKSIEKINTRHSGYGNRGMLLSSTSNIPTQSLTILWASGQHNGIDWLPLIPRRSKK